MEEKICWIESLAGGQVTRREKMTAGQSRETRLVDVTSAKGKLLKLVLRVDMRNGPDNVYAFEGLSN
jgi:hypothetical protein